MEILIWQVLVTPGERMLTDWSVEGTASCVTCKQTMYSLQGFIQFWFCQGLINEREKKRKSALDHADFESETCDRRSLPYLSLKRTLAMVFLREVGGLWQKEVKIIKTFSAEKLNVNSISA